MIDERKEEQQKRLAQTAVGLPKMKDDKHDTGMADGGGYMTLDTLDQNIFVRNLPKLTPKLGPPKMVDEAPDQKGVADGAEYQTLGKLNMNIFKTAKIEKKKKKKSKKKSKSETNLTQDTDEKTDETEHTEAESSVERTKSEEKSLAKNKKKKKKKTSKKHSKKHHKNKRSTHKKKKKHHHHHKKSSSNKARSQPKLKEDIVGKKEGMAEGNQYETLSNLDHNIFTQSRTRSSPSIGTEDDE